MTLSVLSNNLPSGNILMVHPPYVHYSHQFIEDKVPFLPVGLLYSGQILEEKNTVVYHDCQLHNIYQINNFDDFDSIGLTVMGAQNIASAHRVYSSLTRIGVDKEKFYFGGQGIESLDPIEFEKLFSGANLVRRRDLVNPSYWSTSIEDQLSKFSNKDLKTYFTNELTLLLSQGCKYNCNFCGALTKIPENFYNVESNLKAYFKKAQELEINTLDVYVSSLDFFQQALPGGNINLLKDKLKEIVELKMNFGITLSTRGLTRADSYIAASKDDELMSLVKEAGFYQFGFGADGAANPLLLKAMKKGTSDLESDLLHAFNHAEKNNFKPEILYVFGINEDTSKTLAQTEELCTLLLKEFPNSIYRGFPAKDFIPGNSNWQIPSWKKSFAYKNLLDSPELFANLGFETLANSISHPKENTRKLVNKFAIRMSYQAHDLKRVQSFLTIPLMRTDGNELMDEESFELLREIINNYAPDISKSLTLKNLPDYRDLINLAIPKDT